MIRYIALAALGATIAFGGMTGAAQAQTAERVYDNGSVWEVSYIQTKPGMQASTFAGQVPPDDLCDPAEGANDQYGQRREPNQQYSHD